MKLRTSYGPATLIFASLVLLSSAPSAAAESPVGIPPGFVYEVGAYAGWWCDDEICAGTDTGGCDAPQILIVVVVGTGEGCDEGPDPTSKCNARIVMVVVLAGGGSGACNAHCDGNPECDREVYSCSYNWVFLQVLVASSGESCTGNDHVCSHNTIAASVAVLGGPSSFCIAGSESSAPGGFAR